MNTNTNMEAVYGFKKDGVTPKAKPGKKPSNETMKSFYVIDGIPLVQRGRPSPEVSAKRRVVTMPKYEVYDSNIHGLGERDPADDVMVETLNAKMANLAKEKADAIAQKEADKAAKELAKANEKAEKVAKREADKAARANAKMAKATPVATETTIGNPPVETNVNVGEPETVAV
jgi:ElaB/YqjD/DUF883 family membrane-anchored ribosome-binding protein